LTRIIKKISEYSRPLAGKFKEFASFSEFLCKAPDGSVSEIFRAGLGLYAPFRKKSLIPHENRIFRREIAHSAWKSVIPIHQPLIPLCNRSFRYTSCSFHAEIAHSGVSVAHSALKMCIPEKKFSKQIKFGN